MKKNVIIIGAGIAGLAAGTTLKAHGVEPLILEARDRIGGRIHTDRSLGFPIDLGASWAHDLPSNCLTEDPAEFDLQLKHYDTFFSGPEKHALYDEQSRKLNLDAIQESSEFVKSFFDTVLSPNQTETLSNILKQFSQRPALKNWLCNSLACWSGADINHTDRHLWTPIHEETIEAYVLNGYDILINQLATDLNIQLNTVVSEINYSKDHVSVMANGKEYRADKVIVTVPLGVLKNNGIQFTPALPSSKQQAIKEIGNGLLDKTVIQFPHAFWEKDALSIQRLSNESRYVHFYVNYHALMEQPVLVALYGASTAKMIESMSNDEHYKAVIEPLKMIYGDQFVEPIEIKRTRWLEDPFALGAYAYMVEGEADCAFDVLAEPVNNKVFFAGEATHKTLFACVQGAYETGIRAASEITLVPENKNR